MYKKIIVCVDDTPLSERAMRAGADLAARYGARITLLSVVDPALIAGKTYSGLEAVQMLEQYSHTLTDHVNRLGAQLRDMGIVNRQVVLSGRSVETIIEAAENEAADLIVVGSAARGRLRAWLDNDLWSALAHKAPCNVLRITPNGPVVGNGIPENIGGNGATTGAGKYLSAPLSTL